MKLLLSRDATTLPLPPRAVVVPDNVVALTKFRPWENGVVNQIAYSPDGRKLAVASSYAVSLFEAESLEYVDKHWVEKAATSVAFAPDSQHLAAGLQDGRILLWSSWKEAPLTLSGHSGFVTSLAFTTNGQRLLSGSSDGSVRLWDVDDGTQTLVADKIGQVNAVAASPDGKRLAAAGEDGDIRLWDASSAAQLWARHVHTWAVLALTFSPNSTMLATSGDEGVVYLVLAAKGGATQTLPTHSSPVHALAFLPDEETLTLALGLADGSLRLWTPGEAEARPFVQSAHAGSINTVAFAPDGRMLASSSGNDTVRLWRVADGEKMAETEQYWGWVHGLAFAPDGTLVRRVDAPGAVLEKGRWAFETAEINTFPGKPESQSAYTMATDLTPGKIEQSFSSPEAMSFWRLPGHIGTLERAGFDATRLHIHFQSLLSQPLMFAAMILLAACVSLRPPRAGGSVALAVAGLVVAFVVFFVSSYLQALGAGHQIPAFLAAWSPSLICLLLGLGVILHLEDG